MSDSEKFPDPYELDVDADEWLKIVAENYTSGPYPYCFSAEELASISKAYLYFKLREVVTRYRAPAFIGGMVMKLRKDLENEYS